MKKLKLTKQTVRNLTCAEIAAVIGGYAQPDSGTMSCRVEHCPWPPPARKS